MSKPVFLALFSLSFLLLDAPANADNWGHWRGPTGNGVATSGSPPIEWSDTEHIKWKVPIPGRGSGSPVIWGDQVFVVTAVSTKTGDQPSVPQGGTRPQSGRRRRGGSALSKLQFKLLCFDRADGHLLWQQTAIEATPHQGTHSTNGHASASPCTDGKHVYAHYGSRGLFCYTMDGKLKWKRDDFGRMNTRNSFGEGSSPTFFEKTLGGWRVKEGIRHMIQFDCRNLLEPMTGIGPFDIIFCRNAAIYFDVETKRDLFIRLAERLTPEGYLFVGSSECLANLDPRFVAQHHCQSVYYQPNAGSALAAR